MGELVRGCRMILRRNYFVFIDAHKLIKSHNQCDVTRQFVDLECNDIVIVSLVGKGLCYRYNVTPGDRSLQACNGNYAPSIRCHANEGGRTVTNTNKKPIFSL